MKRVCFVVSSPMTVKAFLLHQLSRLGELYELTVVANTDDRNFLAPYGLQVEVVPVPIVRRISPVADLSALFRLYRLFRARGFDLVHSISPKAGLLAALAGRLAGVSHRIHTFTGQVWVTRSGLARAALKAVDRLLAALTTEVLVDSRSQRDFLLDQRVVSAARSRVLANGSISGVDTAKFRPCPETRQTVRNRHGIGDDDVLFLFVGRLNRDKGVADLAAAFSQVSEEVEGCHLMLVGPDEQAIEEGVRRRCPECRSKLHFVGYSDRPEDYMAAADVFCLPSYREGFGSVVIEAGAAGVPAVASRIYGLTDSVEDGSSGYLVPAGDVQALAERMAKLASDRELRTEMGRRALAIAGERFSHERVTEAMVDYYRTLIG